MTGDFFLYAAASGQGHRSVAADANEGIERRGIRLGRHGIADDCGQAEAENDSTAGSGTGFEEESPR